MMHRRFPLLAHEQGAILFAALIILLVMTLIGVAGMQGSMMDERMAGNYKETQRAFLGAEAGLRLGEAYAVANTPGSGGYVKSVTDLYSSGDAVNTDEVIPEYAFTISSPSYREVTTADGTTATSAKGASKKLYTRRYFVDATGQVGTAVRQLRSSYVIADF
jgi:Tfp pilus assembly protein PilX